MCKTSIKVQNVEVVMQLSLQSKEIYIRMSSVIFDDFHNQSNLRSEIFAVNSLHNKRSCNSPDIKILVAS